MAQFPARPVPPAQILEGFLPEALKRKPLPRRMRGLALCLGVRLAGRGGGEWQIRVARGALEVVSEPCGEAPISLVQSVEDWKGALWGGRGGALGDRAAALFRAGPEALPERGPSVDPAAVATALGRLAELDALLRLELTDGDGGDWRVDLRLGPGALPAAPTTTVRLAAQDSEAMLSGELGPLEAFMAGRVQLEGDVALLLRVHGSLASLRG